MPQGTTSFRTLTTLLCVKYIHVGEEGERGQERGGRGAHGGVRRRGFIQE